MRQDEVSEMILQSDSETVSQVEKKCPHNPDSSQSS
jgi:hypothetical protein